MAERFDDSGFRHELLPLVKAWQSWVTSAEETKKIDFGDAADWAVRLYEGQDVEKGFRVNHLKEAGINPPALLLQVNKIAEAMHIFGPSMYVQNPTCLITPSRAPVMQSLNIPTDPYTQMQYQQMVMQQQYTDLLKADTADVLQRVINYSQHELDKERHARKWIGEALLKGMGTLVTELYRPPNANYSMVGSFFQSIDHVLLDPDTEQWDQMTAVAIRRIEKVWQVENKFGLPPGVLEKYSSHESTSRRGERARRRKDGRGNFRANDSLEYWEIYSKMGCGEKLTKDKSVEGTDDYFGQFCYMAICKGCPYFLNLPSWEVNGPFRLPDEALFYKLQWPIPFWLEKDGWPFTELSFHESFNRTWPTGHFRFTKGELEFINWNASFIATKTLGAANTIVAYAKDLEGLITEAMTKSAGGYTMLGLPQTAGKKINEILSVFDPPVFNPELHNSRAIFENNADKRIGLTDHLYGIEPTRQIRSRGEADYREQNSRSRPNYFSRKVDTAITRNIRNESFAMRWLYQPQDVLPIVGPLGAHVWQQLITSTPPEMVVREFDFRIEANSARRPNLERMQDQANQLLQIVLPVAQGFYQAFGDPGLINACFSFWGKAYEYDNIESFLLPDMRQYIQQMQMQQQQAAQQQQIDTTMEELRQAEEKHKQQLRFDWEDQQLENRTRLAESAVKQEILRSEAKARKAEKAKSNGAK